MKIVAKDIFKQVPGRLGARHVIKANMQMQLVRKLALIVLLEDMEVQKVYKRAVAVARAKLGTIVVLEVLPIPKAIARHGRRQSQIMNVQNIIAKKGILGES